jgi:hypothetical protein
LSRRILAGGGLSQGDAVASQRSEGGRNKKRRAMIARFEHGHGKSPQSFWRADAPC